MRDCLMGNVFLEQDMTMPSTEARKQYIKAHNLMPLVTIGPVTIYATKSGDYICMVSDLSICNDGWGPKHGDPTYQPETAYYSGKSTTPPGKSKYLNADIDPYIVVPPQVRSMVPPVVMGSQAKLTRLDSMVSHSAVTGEIGPDYETGEAAYCLAKHINPKISHNAGDGRLIYFYELWPGVAATVDMFDGTKKTYKLQPA